MILPLVSCPPHNVLIISMCRTVLCSRVYTFSNAFQQMRKSSFQGSLYLSRESLGNHFFEGIQKKSQKTRELKLTLYTSAPHAPIYIYIYISL
jgi:hypothetical protein